MSTEHIPLPGRVRPKHFDQIIGQEKIWGKNAALRKLAEEGAFYSLIFWGPPGTGKTTVAQAIGEHSGFPLRVLSAVHAGVADIRNLIHLSSQRLEAGETPVLLFLDEIHRLKKNQQDVLLPALEAGTFRFIGATTENPSFEVNNAILSRSILFKFEKLSTDELRQLILQTLQSEKSELRQVKLAEDVLEIVAQSASGDARKCLNTLEALIKCAPKDVTLIERKHLEGLKDSFVLSYDQKGEGHYDTISAFIKCIRASHPDAALHYLARMLEGGEDPMFIARRLVISASEDIGNANPTGLLMATAAMQSVQMLGMPEARIVLSQVTVYLAGSVKSNRSYLAVDKALEDVRKFGDLEIPLHLRNAPTRLMKEMGYGKSYHYPHDDLQGARTSTYFPKELQGKVYYNPKELGIEKQIAATLKYLRPTED